MVLSSLAEDQLLAMVREVERAKRRLEALDARLIAELEERNLPGKYVMRSTAALLAGLLNLSPREAAARVRQARALGPRLTVTVPLQDTRHNVFQRDNSRRRAGRYHRWIDNGGV